MGQRESKDREPRHDLSAEQRQATGFGTGVPGRGDVAVPVPGGDLSTSDPSRPVELGVMVASQVPVGVRVEVESGLAQALSDLLPGVEWSVRMLPDSSGVGPSQATEILESARGVLLDHDLDLVVVLSDLPLTEGRRAIMTACSAVRGVGVLSVPALGSRHGHGRTTHVLAGMVLSLVGEESLDLLGDEGMARGSRATDGLRDRLRQLAADTPDEPGESAVQYAARVIGGNLGLLLAMVRANQPWRLAVGLSRALAVAGATAVVTLVTSDLWLLADAYLAARFVLLALVAVAAVSITLVVGGGLWERPRGRAQRRQAALFNAATTVTVVLGVSALFVTLLVLSFLAAVLLVDGEILQQVLGHRASAGSYVRIAWLTACLATVGGALGAGLETDAAVKAAAYTTRSSGPDSAGR